NAPPVGEANRRKARELIARDTQQPEPGAATLDGHPLLARGRDLDRRREQLSRDLGQLLSRDRDRPRHLDVRTDLGTDRDIEVGPRQTDTVIRRLDQNVCQYWERRLVRDACPDGRESLL